MKNILYLHNIYYIYKIIYLLFFNNFHVYTEIDSNVYNISIILNIGVNYKVIAGAYYANSIHLMFYTYIFQIFITFGLFSIFWSIIRLLRVLLYIIYWLSWAPVIIHIVLLCLHRQVSNFCCVIENTIYFIFTPTGVEFQLVWILE